MFVRRSLVMMVLVVVILPVAVFRTQNQQAATSSNAALLQNIQLYEVRSDDVALTVSAIGQVRPDSAVALSFTTAGRVEEIYIERDAFVLAGDPLVRLSNAVQSLTYEQSQLQVEQAELALEDLLEVDETAIRIAEAGVRSAQGAYISVANAVSDEDVQAAELAYQQALSAIEPLVIQRDRIGGRFGGDSSQWGVANARIGEQTFNAEIARLRLEDLRNSTSAGAFAAYARVLQAQRELDRVLAGPTQFEIDTATVRIEQAENGLEEAASSVEQTLLTAPFDGVISALNAEVGGLAGPGLTVVELTDLSPLRLTVQVDEIDIDFVTVGQTAQVTLDALPTVDFPAEVINIAPLGTGAGGIVNYDVDIRLSIEDPRVRVGMTAEATIVIEETTDVLVVPNLYIRRDRLGGTAFVNVLRPDNSLEEVEVTIGIQGRENSEITSGLEAGDLVAVVLSGAQGFDLFGG